MVTLVGAGRVNKGVYEQIRKLAPTLIAADGGAEMVLKYGDLPEKVIGDLDSLTDAIRAKIPEDRICGIAEQETTDFDKCLRSIKAPLIIGLGFMGRRVDHFLSAMNVLARHAPGKCILVNKRQICFHVPQDFVMSVPVGARISLFPMKAVSGQSSGLRWPIDGLVLEPSGRVGTSNEADQDRVRLMLDGTGLLAIMKRAVLPQAIDALLLR